MANQQPDPTEWLRIQSHLLSAAIHMAPNGLAQAAFSQMLNEMNRDNLPYKETAIHMLDAMLDGLRHGNWPNFILAE